MLNPYTSILEDASILELESIGALFVKKRESNYAQIVPRLSLPFLFRFPRSQRGYRLDDNKYLVQRGRLPVLLAAHAPMLMHNIGLALFKSVKELPNAFERVVPWIELLRVVAMTSEQPDGAIRVVHDLLPGSVPSEDFPDLVVSRDITRKPILVEVELNPDTARGSSMEKAKSMIEKAKEECRDAVLCTQSKSSVSQLIEYVNRSFCVGHSARDVDDVDVPMLALCSMKLRKYPSDNPANVAMEIHKSFQKDQPFVVIVYCCWRRDEIVARNLQLPPRTLIVPFETLHNIMKPFGANCLLEVAESKSTPRL